LLTGRLSPFVPRIGITEEREREGAADADRCKAPGHQAVQF
jgi:hypothetical protein